jgi:hypothetical protein
LKKSLRTQNLGYRFIDAKRYYENGGYHPKGWAAYRVKTSPSATMDTQSFGLGRDPEGVFRRGTTILAVKPMEQVEEHRRILRERSNRASKGVNKQKADELRQMARDADLDAHIQEGYEENED